jgi:hypothetical protein
VGKTRSATMESKMEAIQGPNVALLRIISSYQVELNFAQCRRGNYDCFLSPAIGSRTISKLAEKWNVALNWSWKVNDLFDESIDSIVPGSRNAKTGSRTYTCRKASLFTNSARNNSTFKNSYYINGYYIPPGRLPSGTAWKTPTPGRSCRASFPKIGGLMADSGTSRQYVIRRDTGSSS